MVFTFALLKSLPECNSSAEIKKNQKHNNKVRRFITTSEKIQQ
ncbi:hypothetical protein DOY81_005215, partial [Sarcophaga bullata]